VTLTLSNTIAASPARVFDALIDPNVLRRCIHGCEELAETGTNAYEARLKIGLAGLKGTYTGKATIQDARPADSLTLIFEAKGSQGFVRGSAAIALSGDATATRIACDADVQVGGLIAAVGSRLVEAAAKKLAGDFFRQLASEIAE
jgi:uncharacterized protein